MKQRISRLRRRLYAKSIPRDMSTSLSDNQAYPQVCLNAASDYAIFNNFRRDPIYTEILEHVSLQQGRDYLDLISADADLMAAMAEFKLNDAHGNPVIFEYPGVGGVSGTTLRYVKVLADLKAHFKTLDDLSICEIGVGYGGQCRVINAYFKPATYRLVDIQPALRLAQRFLDHYVLDSVMSYRTMNELPGDDYDLVISNYAFTELRRSLQDIYLNRAILNSRRGYITYNEITPDDFNSYTSAELLEIIPGSRIIPEQPLTHPRNCIIVWGDESLV